MENRIIVDLCTPTRERRPTFRQDIEDDIQVMDFENSYDGLIEMRDVIADILDYDVDEILDDLYVNEIIDNEVSPEELVENVIDFMVSYCEDPGDGSPNFLYVCRNGKVSDYSMPYDCLENLDLGTCSERDVKDAILKSDDFMYEDDEE